MRSVCAYNCEVCVSCVGLLRRNSLLCWNWNALNPSLSSCLEITKLRSQHRILLFIVFKFTGSSIGQSRILCLPN